MSKSEAYKKQEPIKQTVNEPVTEYRSPSTMGEMELLSDEIIIGAVVSQYGEVRCAFYKQDHIYYQIYEDRIEVIFMNILIVGIHGFVGSNLLCL